MRVLPTLCERDGVASGDFCWVFSRTLELGKQNHTVPFTRLSLLLPCTLQKRNMPFFLKKNEAKKGEKGGGLTDTERNCQSSHTPVRALGAPRRSLPVCFTFDVDHTRTGEFLKAWNAGFRLQGFGLRFVPNSDMRVRWGLRLSCNGWRAEVDWDVG
eukprot:3316835-Rhodomonas_salina.2